MIIRIENKSILDIEADVIIVNQFEGVKYTSGVTKIVDEANNNIITKYVIEKEGFEGRTGEIYKLTLGEKGKKIYIAGLGEQTEFSYKKIRDITAKIVREVKGNAKRVVTIMHGGSLAGFYAQRCAQMIAEGALSGIYAFDKYKTQKQENKIEEFIIAETDKERYEQGKEGVRIGIITGEAVNQARDLINESSQYLYPETLAEYAKKESGVETKVYNKEEIKELGMNAFLAVGQGSSKEPKFIHMGYRNEKAKRKIAIVGKGITFDAAICSDLQRCVESLNVLLEDKQLPVLYTKELRERDWGSFTGRKIESVRNKTIPSDVETVECMLSRARSFLAFIKSDYPDKTLLVMSHGLFCRAIQAEYWGKPMKEIEPMRNASYRILVL